MPPTPTPPSSCAMSSQTGTKTTRTDVTMFAGVHMPGEDFFSLMAYASSSVTISPSSS